MKVIFHKLNLHYRLTKLLLISQKLISVILIVCVASTYFAMQIVLGPSIAMTQEIQSSPMTDSFCLDFTDNSITEHSRQLLSDLFNERTTVHGCYVSSGFYGAFSNSMPTILGVKNCGDNSWYIQAEGRYFSEAEIDNHSNVVIISRYDYGWSDFDIESHSVQIAGIDHTIVGLGDYPSAMQFFIGKQDLYQKVSMVQEIQDQLDEAFSDHNRYSQVESLQDTLRQVSQTILIPYTTYEQHEYIPSVVCIMFTGLPEDEKTDMYRALSELFPEATVVIPPDASQFMATSMKSDIITSLALSGCCLAFLYALFVFWIDYNRIAIRSCRVVGASKQDIQTIIYSSWILILLLGYLGAVLFASMFNRAFDLLKMSMYMHIGHHAVLFTVPLLITAILVKFGSKEMR